MKGKSNFFFIPGPLPGLNEIIGAANRNRHIYAKMKRELTESIALRARAARLIRPERADLCFVWYERDRRRDPDNVAGGGRKFILDGLVKAGVLQGDGWRHVARWHDAFLVHSSQPGVYVTIDEDWLNPGGVQDLRRRVAKAREVAEDEVPDCYTATGANWCSNHSQAIGPGEKLCALGAYRRWILNELDGKEETR